MNSYTFLTLSLVFLFGTLCPGQDIVYTNDEGGNGTEGMGWLFTDNTCSYTEEIPSQFVASISYVSDTLIYAIYGFDGTSWLRAYNFETGTFTVLDTLPFSSEPAIAHSIQDSLLYIAGSELRVYDLNTAQVTSKGPFGSGGVTYEFMTGMTMVNGKLYGFARNNSFAEAWLIEVNITDPSQSRFVADLAGKVDLWPTGLTTINNGCGQTQTYLSSGSFTGANIYTLDVSNGDVVFVCNSPVLYNIKDMASTTEALVYNCAPEIDLDAGGNSAPGSDYFAGTFCRSDSLALLAATNVQLTSFFGVDSVRLFFSSPVPDGAAEQLRCSAGLLACDATDGLLLTNSAAASDAQLAAWLTDGFYYQHLDPAPTPGLRTVGLVAYDSCYVSDTSYIHFELVLPSPATVETATVCPGEAYPWNGQAVSTPGQTCLTLTSAVGCDSTACLELTLLPNSTADLTQEICQGSCYGFNGQVLSAAGTYFDTLVAANGCDSLVSLQLEVAAAVAVSLTAELCAGQVYDFFGLLLDQPGSYQQTSSGVCDTTYTLTLSPTDISLTILTDSICQGGSYDFNGQPLSTAGAYLDTLVAANGCDSIVALQLGVTPTVTVSLTDEICTGQAYVFFDQSLYYPGTYQQTVSGACDTLFTLTLDPVPVPIATQNATLCPGESYFFNDQPLTAGGIYLDTLLSAGGCDSIVALELFEVPGLAPVITGATKLCVGGSELLGVIGSYATYRWSTGDTTPVVQIDAPGTFALTVTDPAGCTAADTIVVSVDDGPLAQFSIKAAPCAGSGGGTLRLDTIIGGTPPYLVSLDDGPFTAQALFDELPAGTYTLSIEDGRGCLSESTVVVPAATELSLTTEPAYDTVLGDSVRVLFATNAGSAVDLSLTAPGEAPRPVDFTTWLAPLRTTTYTAIMTDADGCTATATFTVRVRRTDDWFVPSAFSPNRDGVNDRFVAFPGPAVRRVLTFDVYDRWGGRVYAGTDTSDWDGNVRDRPAPVGVYTYALRYELVTGETATLAGAVTLLR